MRTGEGNVFQRIEKVVDHYFPIPGWKGMMVWTMGQMVPHLKDPARHFAKQHRGGRRRKSQRRRNTRKSRRRHRKRSSKTGGRKRRRTQKSKSKRRKSRRS